MNTDPFIPPRTAADLRRLRSWLVSRRDNRRHLRLSTADARLLAEDPEMQKIVASFIEVKMGPKGAKLPAMLYGFDLAIGPELKDGFLWLT